MDHHYIPQCYLREWASSDGKLWEYQLQPRRNVSVRRVYPAQTGYQPDLYKLPGMEGDAAHRIERVFMGMVDSGAAKALRKMNDHPGLGWWPEKDRAGWVRFFMSLMLRNPEELEKLRAGVANRLVEQEAFLKANYARLRGPNEPLTYEEFQAQRDPHELENRTLDILQHLLKKSKSANLIANMLWSNRFITGPGDLATSDRPVVMTNGLGRFDAHICIATGPRCMFIASMFRPMLDEIYRLPEAHLVSEYNRLVIGQAQRFAWATDNTHKEIARRTMRTLDSMSFLGEPGRSEGQIPAPKPSRRERRAARSRS